MNLEVEDGGFFIVEIAADYLDLHVDRKSDIVPDYIHQYILAGNIQFIRRTGKYPEAEHYWVSLFCEFNYRVRALRIDMAELPPQRTPTPINISRINLEEHAQSIANQLFVLPIDETLDWLTQLTFEWALCYDLNATRQQIIDAGHYALAMGKSELTLKYYPIKIVADGTEFGGISIAG